MLLKYGDYVHNGARTMLRDPVSYPHGSRVTFRFAVRLHVGWPLQLHQGGDRWIVYTPDGQIDIGAASYAETEFTFDFLFSRDESGSLIVWRDGEQVINYTGQTMHDGEFPAQFTRGVYRPWWNVDPGTRIPKNPLQSGEPDYRMLDIRVLFHA